MPPIGSSGPDALDRRTTDELAGLRTLVDVVVQEFEQQAALGKGDGGWTLALANRIRHRLRELERAQTEGDDAPVPEPESA